MEIKHKKFFLCVLLFLLTSERAAFAADQDPLLDYANSKIPLTDPNHDRAQDAIISATNSMLRLQLLKGETSEIPADMKDAYLKSAALMAYSYSLANFHRLSLPFFVRVTELQDKPANWLAVAVEFDIANEDAKALDAFKKAEQDKAIKGSVALDRGQFYYVRGNYEAAQKDFVEAFKEVPDSQRAYAALWSQLVDERLSQKEEIKTSNTWPWPILDVLQGKKSESDLIESINSLPEKNQNGALCEALFYLGEHFWIKDEKDKSRRFFRAALSTRLITYNEYQLIPRMFQTRHAIE